MEIFKQEKKIKPAKINFDNTKITFVKPSDNTNELDPVTKINTYYQICQFKNKFTKKYDTRKIVFNEKHEILKIFERDYSLDELNKFIKHHRKNKFKIYAVDEISLVELPPITDIICCQSELLNNDNKTYGWQQFGNDMTNLDL
jgi:hypothetical protein